MSDPVNRANERGDVPEQEAAAGFDVHGAAAGVLAELAATAARPSWTAADYGWDPADANAVAWAAYYSELGVDPAALAAQQAAEATARDDAAPVSEATPGAGAATVAAEEGASPPLDVLTFAPIDGGQPADVPTEPPHDSTPDALDGGSAIWELLPGDAPLPEPPPLSDADFRHDLPSGWAADGARLEEFQLASGGSFDEATAPLGDLLGEQDEDVASPLGDLSSGLPGLALEPAPQAVAAKATEPVPLPELAPADAAAGDLTLELGPLDAVDEPATPPAPALPSLELDFDAPLAPLAAAPADPAPASAAAALDLELDLGWASHAVPAGDDGVDVAAFEAEPELDLEPLPPDRTAMWGLPAAASKPAVVAPAAAAAIELLGDAAPLPTPPVSEPDDAPLGEPVDGALFLEPIFPSAAAGVDPWDAAPPAAGLAVTDRPGPFDLGALDEPAPGGPFAPSAAAVPAEEILEVGDDVVEVPADAPPQPPVETPPAPIEPPAPPPPPVEEPPAPEPVRGPAIVTCAAAPAVPVDARAAYVPGEHRVVVHTLDGQVKRGRLCDTALDGPQLALLPQAAGAPEPLASNGVKAIFFMLGASEAPPSAEGKKVRVTFRDGRQVAGFSPDYDPDRVGFFMVPADTRTHTARIWVYRSAVRQVTVSG